MITTIEVNGIEYIPREEKKVQPQGKFIPKYVSLMAMGMMFMDYSMPICSDPFIPKEKKEPQRPNVSIIKEYGLIQLKKSNLSRKKRDWVVWAFERQYTKLNHVQIQRNSEIY